MSEPNQARSPALSQSKWFAEHVQPHMHWSTGLLIDACHIPDGRIDLIDGHSSGSGHGWAIG